MKSINFLPTISKKEQLSLYRWYRFSCLLIALTMIGITCLALWQGYQWYQLYQQHTTIEQQLRTIQPDIQNHEKIVQTHQELLKKQSHVTKCQQALSSMLSQCDKYFCSHGTPVYVQSCVLQKNNAKIIIQCKEAAQAHAYIAALNGTNLFNNMQLINLQSDPQKNISLTATVQSTQHKTGNSLIKPQHKPLYRSAQTNI